MNHRTKTVIIIVLALCYVIIGHSVWSSTRVMGVSFWEELAEFLFVALLWPLLTGMLLLYSAAISMVALLIVAVILVVKRRYVLAASLALTLLVLFSSLFLPATITRQEKLRSVSLGLPVAFLVQDQSQFEPPLPWQTRIASAHENPTDALWPQLALSFAILFVLFFSIFHAGTLLYSSQKNTQLTRR